MKSLVSTIIKKAVLLLVGVTMLLAPLTKNTYAATTVQREDVMKNSPEHDGKNGSLDAC